HGVIEVAPAHFLFKTDGQGFFGELGHGKIVAMAMSKATSDSKGEACCLLATLNFILYEALAQSLLCTYLAVLRKFAVSQ
ncbi:MAG: hypothetical protein WCG50_15835, partial [Rhodoferax sp.]|uniref:hypothetical protein n=1 Tax=Rhodoferax sp. TaxID=50421 RepID=UPI003018C58D